MHQLRITVGLGIALAIFALAPMAQASTTVQIALTAITQMPTTAGDLNELEHTTQKLKITNKDILALLAATHPADYPDALMAGTLITINVVGQFELLNADDVLLDSIDIAHLQITNLSPSVYHLLSNTNTSVNTYKKIWAQRGFFVNLATAYAFELQGMLTGNATEDDFDSSWMSQYQLTGQGLWVGRNALITGRIVCIGRNVPVL